MFTQHFQLGHYYGKGIPAAARFERDMRELFRHGELPSIDKRELEAMIKSVHDKFGDATSFTERDFYTKVCKPLGINLNDRVSASEAEDVSKKIGMRSKYTGRLDRLAEHDDKTREKDFED